MLVSLITFTVLNMVFSLIKNNQLKTPCNVGNRFNKSQVTEMSKYSFIHHLSGFVLNMAIGDKTYELLIATSTKEREIVERYMIIIIRIFAFKK